jgi:hypothetical protein
MLTEVQDRDAIVSRAIEIASAEERDAYIAEACGNDAALRRQVEERVAAHFLNSNSHRSGETAATAPLPAKAEGASASTNHATDLASSQSTSSQVWTLLRQRPRALAGVVVSQLVLLVAAAGGTSFAVWAWRAEEQARGTAQEAIEERDRAQSLAKQVNEQVDRAEAARKVSEKEREQAVEAKKATQSSLEDTKAVLAFFNGNVLSASRPTVWSGAQGKDVTLRKAVDAAEAKVAGAFADRPLAEAVIREMLGATYSDLEAPALAVKQLERALALRTKLEGQEHANTTACRNKLAVAYRLAGRPDEASRLYDQHLPSSSPAAPGANGTSRPRGGKN